MSDAASAGGQMQLRPHRVSIRRLNQPFQPPGEKLRRAPGNWSWLPVPNGIVKPRRTLHCRVKGGIMIQDHDAGGGVAATL